VVTMIAIQESVSYTRSASILPVISCDHACRSDAPRLRPSPRPTSPVKMTRLIVSGLSLVLVAVYAAAQNSGYVSISRGGPISQQ
jgi:hypothetical protein